MGSCWHSVIDEARKYSKRCQHRMRNSFMNGSALPSSDTPPPPSKPRISNGGIRLSGASSNTRPRSQSSLSVADNNSLLSDNLKRPNQKRVSASGNTVDGSQLSLKLQNNLIQSVKKSLAKTKRQWDRTGFIHIIYVLVLLTYSFVGGALFRVLDGPHADRTLANHQNRCVECREQVWDQLVIDCANRSFADCQNQTRHSFMLLDHCLRTAPQVPFNHSTSDYWNSLIYAITVFTTIGYGNIVVLSPEGRFAMLLYAMIGIPLFFAFLNDMGQWFHFKFLKIYDWVRRRWMNSRLYAVILDMRRRRKLTPNSALSNVGKAKVKQKDETGDKDGHDGLIFTFAVGVLIFYLVVVCGLLVAFVQGQWTFFQAFYFLFQSISLIGFGDEFPENPNIVLINITFIIIGIILLSMCFFILQEWIRGKTYRLSTQVRRSVRRWRHYRPATNGILDRNRRRVKTARFTVPLPHLGGASEHWRRRTNRIDENVAGQRLAVVDDCSPGPGRRAVVTVLTYESDHSPEETVMRRPIPARRDGVHSVDETLISGQKWSSKRPRGPDGALEAEDAIFLRPDLNLANRRLNDRRHTVMCLDEVSESNFDERKRTPSWLKSSLAQNRYPKQRTDKTQKRLSFHDRPARFGKFQWIEQTHDEEEEDEDLEEESGEEIVEVREAAVESSENCDYSSSSEKDDYL